MTLREKIQQIVELARAGLRGRDHINTFAFILDLAEQAMMSDELPSGVCRCGHPKGEHKYDKGCCLEYPCDCKEYQTNDHTGTTTCSS